jgi:hypothetical protein
MKYPATMPTTVSIINHVNIFAVFIFILRVYRCAPRRFFGRVYTFFCRKIGKIRIFPIDFFRTLDYYKYEKTVLLATARNSLTGKTFLGIFRL